MLKKIFGLLLIAYCMSSCLEPKNESKTGVKKKVLIDNSTRKKITITIDGEVIALDSLQSKELSLTSGKHNLKFIDSTFDFNIPEKVDYNKYDLLINPTRSAYIFEQVSYLRTSLTPEELEKRRKDPEHNSIPYGSINIMGLFTINGNFKKTKEMFITDDWDYGIDESIPAEAESARPFDEVLKIKLYREMGFLLRSAKKK
jgi:hypothetical protein